MLYSVVHVNTSAKAVVLTLRDGFGVINIWLWWKHKAYRMSF